VAVYFADVKAFNASAEIKLFFIELRSRVKFAFFTAIKKN
jgi:hypothetical protein